MYRQKSKGWYKHKDFIFMDLCCIVIAFIVTVQRLAGHEKTDGVD